MATKASIIAEIAAKVLPIGGYSVWRIGLTHDPAERKQYWTEKESTACWSQWQADSLSDAQAIESHFINNDKGMKGQTGGDLSPWSPVYVYVFQAGLDATSSAVLSSAKYSSKCLARASGFVSPGL